MRLLTAAFLRDLGYTVVEAASAETAEALVAGLGERLDLLLCGVELPGADGATLAARLRAERPDLRVVFVAGAPVGPALTGEIVLRKPVAGADLAAAVLAALDRRRPLHLTPAARLMNQLRTPALRAAYLAWHAARLSGENLPRIEAFGLDALGFEDQGVLVSVERGEDNEPSFRFLRLGAALQGRLGRALEAERTLSVAADEEAVGTMAGAYRRCARTAAPVYDAARFDFGDGHPQTCERLLLPLSANGSSVTHEVGVVMFGDGVAASAATPASRRGKAARICAAK
ncbi:response regulator [Falsiroseomonas sp. HW251]|uniref:response regulator n=1 Tax=Falsiroseomonas sp. HW251 TaxID=3390998 RepID=UPI003D31169D